MANVLFTNVRIIDATGAQPYQGSLLVQGNRIARIGRGTRSLPTAGVTVIDGAGATLMQGSRRDPRGLARRPAPRGR